MTKWEKFAKEKGIQKKKKDKKVFDETLDVSISNPTNYKLLNLHPYSRNGFQLMVTNAPRQRKKKNGSWRFLRM